MANINLVHKVVVQLSADTQAEQKLFYTEDDDSAQEQIGTYSNYASGQIKMPTGTSYQTLSFGTLQTIGGLYVVCNGPVTLNFNSTVANGAVAGGSVINLVPSSGATGIVCKFFAEMNFQTLTITSQPTQTINGLYCAWGDVAS